MALSRPVTALDNERFTVQSVMLRYAVPVVLVGAAGPRWGPRGARGWGTLGARLRQACERRREGPGVSRPVPGVEECEWAEDGVPQSLGTPWGRGELRPRLSCPQQASFLITNALRFMLKAPGVTTWQYTLLQLQVRPPSPLLPQRQALRVP